MSCPGQCATFSQYPSLDSDDKFSVSGDGKHPLEKKVLYKGRWIVPIQVLVRLKVFQLAGVAALAMPMATFLTQVTLRASWHPWQYSCLVEGCYVFTERHMFFIPVVSVWHCRGLHYLQAQSFVCFDTTHMERRYAF